MIAIGPPPHPYIVKQKKAFTFQIQTFTDFYLIICLSLQRHHRGGEMKQLGFHLVFGFPGKLKETAYMISLEEATLDLVSLSRLTAEPETAQRL